MKSIEIMDITIRDGQQCLWATRLTTEDLVPIARTMDEAGFFIIDLNGGAAIDASVLFLGEDPFERIRKISKLITKTPLNFNTRGQSVFRWTQYADDVTEFTLELMQRNGIRSIMVFDSLNDFRNMTVTMACAKRLGLYIIGAVTYTISPVHTNEHFAQKARDLIAMGADAIEIKDPGGLLTPARARELIPIMRVAAGKAQLQLHSHCTFGHGTDTYHEALKLGDYIDLFHAASRPLAFGYSLPPHDYILDEIEAAGFTHRVSRDAVREIAKYFTTIARRSGRDPGKVLPMQDVDGDHHQVPGGMMSNLIRQLEEQGQRSRLDEVLEEVGRVRRDIGYPIVVSPMAQYLGTQAVLNVLSGKRYSIVPQEIKQYVLGYYGEIPGEIDPEVRQLIAGDEPSITVRPGDLIPPMMDRYRRELAPYDSDEELALKIFYTAQQVAENKRMRLLAKPGALATDAGTFLAREILADPSIEICEVKAKDFVFAMSRND